MSNTNINDKLDILDVDENGNVVDNLPAIRDSSAPTEHEEDFDLARENIIAIIQNGEEAIDGLKVVAEQSQHPRAYEVLSNLFKTMIEANKDLIDIHKKKKEAFGPSKPDTVNNNLFVGSSSDLLRLIRQKEENDDV